MAVDTVEAPEAVDLGSSERRGLALEALWEIESIAETICKRSDELDPSDLWIRAFAVRLLDLASVGMSAIGDDLSGAFEEAQRTLRPFNRSATEAQHG